MPNYQEYFNDFKNFESEVKIQNELKMLSSEHRYSECEKIRDNLLSKVHKDHFKEDGSLHILVNNLILQKLPMKCFIDDSSPRASSWLDKANITDMMRIPAKEFSTRINYLYNPQRYVECDAERRRWNRIFDDKIGKHEMQSYRNARIRRELKSECFENDGTFMSRVWMRSIGEFVKEWI